MGVQYLCDRCGRKIDANRTHLRIEGGRLRSSCERLDLCVPCVESLSRWLAQRRHHPRVTVG
jgi:hypothetical protein